MNTIQIKKDFHNLIERTHNQELLLFFYELMKRKVLEKDGLLWSNLSKEEQIELIEALKESENHNNLISHEEMKKKHKKWLN